jgi:rod shape-determining protein MreC
MKTLNIVTLLLFVAVTVAVMLLDTPTTRQIQARVLSIFSPFVHASAVVERSTGQVLEPSINPKELKRENDKLRLEVQTLRVLTRNHDELVTENNQLRSMIGYKERSPFKHLVAAHVIKRSAATWWGTLIVDKGTDDGVTSDSPVVTDAGLVGKTSRVTKNMSEIILLTDDRCRLAALVEDTREKGISYGEMGGSEIMPDLHLKFMNKNAPIVVGTRVLSSGDGGVFPAGLLLGTVKRFENKEIGGECVVRPAVDFTRLSDVFIIGMERIAKAEPAAMPVAVPVAEPQVTVPQ